MGKKGKIRLQFCKGDAIVIFIIVMLAIFLGAVFWIKTGNRGGDTVVIYQDGEKIQELPLDKNTEILIENRYTNRLVIKDKKAAIVESDCPGRDCVHSGWIGEAGRSLVCLPNRVEIRIQRERESEVDFIVR